MNFCYATFRRFLNLEKRYLANLPQLPVRCVVGSSVAISFLLLCMPLQAVANPQIIEKKIPELIVGITTVAAGEFELIVTPLMTRTETSATSQYLTNPGRIVLDISGVKIPKNYSFDLQGPYFKSIRLGIHPEFTRIVVDLRSSGALKGSVEKRAAGALGLGFSIQDSGTKANSFHQPSKEVSPPQTPTVTPTLTASATVSATPTIKQTIANTPSATATAVVQAEQPAIEANKASLPIRKVPDPPQIATVPQEKLPQEKLPQEKLPQQQSIPQQALPTNTLSQAVEQSAPIEESVQGTDLPLSTLLQNKESLEASTPTTVNTPADPLSHHIIGEVKKDAIEMPIGPENGSQYLVDIRYDYQIQDHTPLLRLVLMSGANFNLVKKDSQTYQLIVAKAGIKNRALTIPSFPPHDFVGFTLVHPQYERESLIVTIGVDRGSRISAFARGNEIWIRTANK